MDITSMVSPAPKFWQVMARGFCNRCPSCGKGRLLIRYLHQVMYCKQCKEQFGHIRADDGPAWLTILVVGHVLAPIMLAVIPTSNWTDVMSMMVWPGLALILTLAFLPCAKGLFIAMIWRTKSVGSEPGPVDNIDC